MQTFEVSEPYIDINCGLSESPFWEEKANILRFVDIVDKAVYRVDLDKGPSSLRKTVYESSISITADLASSEDSFIFGGKYGIGVASKDSSEMKYIKPFWSEEEIRDGKDRRMRANDGAVDSKGRFWSSAQCDPEVTKFAPEAVLFRLDLDGGIHRVLTGLTIPNGMSWSQDDKTLYFTDTSDGVIYAYDFEAESGDISNKRVFFRVEEEGRGPDGHVQDEHGNLWVAIWGSWKVVRISPEGQVTAEIRVPTRCPTAVAFAGEDVYITSEAEQEPEKYPDSVRFQGCVFKCHVGVKGRLANKAAYESIVPVLGV
ncbi:unnamed protein product [Parascedosporium putredinis]|uniref:SMP-30/Gluconolactonase/LRE-like region domain-containing protein n=1 Tax=Parascedosporium putredinis TaxID=1442378 RepID=A0A9P1HDH3_9PEZI|nr:unnamed protein product [Parascedosporium putredinis]CAI8004828.1 unnamed protein product [Parascedosporium putredinis]